MIEPTLPVPDRQRTVGGACEELGVSARTLRYYEELGFLQPGRTTGGHRLYGTPEIEIVELGNEFAGDLVLNGTSFPIAYAPEGAANVRGLIKTLFPVTEISHVEMVPVTEKSRLLLCLPMPPDLKTKPMGGN